MEAPPNYTPSASTAEQSATESLPPNYANTAEQSATVSPPPGYYSYPTIQPTTISVSQLNANQQPQLNYVPQNCYRVETSPRRPDVVVVTTSRLCRQRVCGIVLLILATIAFLVVLFSVLYG